MCTIVVLIFIAAIYLRCTEEDSSTAKPAAARTAAATRTVAADERTPRTSESIIFPSPSPAQPPAAPADETPAAPADETINAGTQLRQDSAEDDAEAARSELTLQREARQRQQRRTSASDVVAIDMHDMEDEEPEADPATRSKVEKIRAKMRTCARAMAASAPPDPAPYDVPTEPVVRTESELDVCV